MANKKMRLTYSGMNQDIAKTRYAKGLYYDAKNIKLNPVEGQTAGTVSNSYGNSFKIQLPIPNIVKSTQTIYYGDKQLHYTNTELNDIQPTGKVQQIIGDVATTNGAVLFSTDNTIDCIWLIPDLDADVLDIELLYLRKLGFSTEYPIQAIFNYENELLQKVYWVDGNNYLRFLNIKQSVANGFNTDIIDIPADSINSKSTINISRPTVSDSGGGGTHTAGVIQYAYTLYNLNGSETAISPLSDTFPLDKGAGLGGGDVNEVVGSLPIVHIKNIDTKYEYLKLYSVKYTEYNGLPEVSLIYDGKIGNYSDFTFNDTGTKTLANLSIEEFLFLGADPIKPGHIVAKDNILFAANNEATAYKLDIDTRAYSFNKDGSKAEVFDNVVYTGTGDIPFTGTKWDVATKGFDLPKDFDAVNLNFDEYRYTNNPISNSGTPIVSDAVYSEDVQGTGEIILSSSLDSTYSDTLIGTCDPGNTSVGIVRFPLQPSTSSNYRFNILEDGDYKFSTTATFDYNIGATERIKVSSIEATLRVYANASSSTIVREVKANKLTLAETIFELVEHLEAGQSVEFAYVVHFHYSNDSCPYQADDPYAEEIYQGSGPFKGPDETGQTAQLDFTANQKSFSISKVDILDKYVKLPILATAGESSVVGGEFISNYTGTASITIDSTINMNGVAMADAGVYSLGILRNDVLIKSFALNLGSTGLVYNTFTTNNINMVSGDVFKFILINNQDVLPGQPIIAKQDFNFNASGTLNIRTQTAAGSNGEGGTGKYLSYELTRSTIDEVNLPTKQAKFFKDNEIYRIGIVFFNSIGQYTEAKWIADFKAPQGNLEGQFNTLKVTFNSAFYDYINTLDDEHKPVGYNIVRALRTSVDRTIISQGIMTGMFVQDYTKEYKTTDTYSKRAAKNSSLIKTPIPLTRGYGNGRSISNTYYPIFPTKHNITMNESESLEGGRPKGDEDKLSDPIVDEIYRDQDDDNKRQQSWQYTKMFQMYSPEATFHMPISVTDKDQLHVLGYMPRDKYRWWDFSVNYETKGPYVNYKSKEFTQGEVGTFYPHVPSGFGIIGPAYRTTKDSQSKRSQYSSIDTKHPTKHSRRLHVYKSFFPLERADEDKAYDILNTPEVTELGQGVKSYNNDISLQYINNLSLVVSDSKKWYEGGADDEPGIDNVASENNRCLTIVLGDAQADHETRIGLEDLYYDLNTNEWDVELFGEIRKTNDYIYSGALYGGYDYISRSRTRYVPIGDLYNISIAEAKIMSPGDTFVQKFRNTRLTRTEASTYQKGTMTVVETLEYLVETTVNLEERNDTSLGPWDSIVDPTAKEGTSYNKVYSTDDFLQTYSGDNTKIREVSRSETEIIASKVKIPGEFIESWVDFRPNEVQYLDGKYGPINGLLNHWDEVYAWQDFAVAKIAINPRVQTQGEDGVSIELGSGKVLHDYQYLSTKSGSINKWSIVSTNSGIYYFDGNNKQLQRIQPGSGVQEVSEAKGLHTFLHNNIDRSIIENDNPVTGKGVVAGYDTVNGDIYTTFLQEGAKDITVSFNEKVNAYVSFYSFIPTRYIIKGDRFYTVPKSNDSLWLHDVENYQQYYNGAKEESYITLMVNTDVPNVDKIFNSIEFDSEVTLDDIDDPKGTITSIEAWNTYQESGRIPLVVGKNIKRKFRTWRAMIPREKGKRNRLRDKWLFLKLGFNPEDNKKLILHDIIINYTV